MKIMKSFLLSIFLTLGCALVSYGQSDSIFAINAHVANGKLQLSFNSTYSPSQFESLMVEIYDSNDKLLKQLGVFLNGDGTLSSQSPGTYDAQTLGNGIIRYTISRDLEDDIKLKKLKYKVYVFNRGKGKSIKSNELKTE